MAYEYYLKLRLRGDQGVNALRGFGRVLPAIGVVGGSQSATATPGGQIITYSLQLQSPIPLEDIVSLATENGLEVLGAGGPHATKEGWLVTADGTQHRLPAQLVDQEYLSWPLTLPESPPGTPTQYVRPEDLYRRHEMAPFPIVVFLRDSSLVDGRIPLGLIQGLLNASDPSAPRRSARG